VGKEERPERVALVEPEARVDNHGDPERGEEGEEWQVAALPVVSNDAGCGVISSSSSSGSGSGAGGEVAANDGAEGPSHCTFPELSSAALDWSSAASFLLGLMGKVMLVLLPPASSSLGLRK
jgi:hypothetical protein